MNLAESEGGRKIPRSCPDLLFAASGQRQLSGRKYDLELLRRSFTIRHRHVVLAFHERSTTPASIFPMRVRWLLLCLEEISAQRHGLSL